ncbi:hypothetical protein [Pseudarthrobacter sp. H2]|uniref:hypothetical protein n=1 Tax=Pseudarthrobacter sp. H2 TaxID=3418415 RepID=UPI003CF37DA0
MSAHLTTMMTDSLPRTAARLLLAGGALLLTGCQPVSVLNRTVDVTPSPAPAREAASGHSAGMVLHFLDARFGITCATDSVGDSTRGTAALMCTWRTGPP